MTDLVCVHCGIACTYADAYIADLEDDGVHEFVEPMHNKVDIVTA